MKNCLSVSFAVYMTTLTVNQIRASYVRMISGYQIGRDVKWSNHGLMLEIMWIWLQEVRNTTTNINEDNRCCRQRFEPRSSRIYVTSIFEFRSIVYVDTNSKILNSWLNLIHGPCDRMIVQCLIQQTVPILNK